MQEKGSRDAAAAALRMAVSATREEEAFIKEDLSYSGICVSATDFGGEYITSISKMIDRIVSVAKRDGVIGESHAEEGSVAGAAREAISQIVQKAVGLNVGGKIAVARLDDHVAVGVFFGVGMMHLNEVAVGLGHRVV
ncbi:MAG: hut operon positive regulator HutP [Clostridiales bacterium]|nr:MAG: hut operon positive regulator HutP [Clostridiales bacterium]